MHFLHKCEFFLNSPKICHSFGLLLQEILLPRTIKNRPIWSHWLQLTRLAFQCFRDDEILDSFDGDNFNNVGVGCGVETPTIQRRAFRNRSFRQPISNSTQELSTSDNDLDNGGQSRRSHKFRALTGETRWLSFICKLLSLRPFNYLR